MFFQVIDRRILLLSVAYAANIGGTGVITGSPPNLVLPGVRKSSSDTTTKSSFFMVQILDLISPDHPLSYGTWMAFTCPLMVANLLSAWIWMQAVLWICKKRIKSNEEEEEGDMEMRSRREEEEETRKENIRDVISRSYNALGPFNMRELTVSVCFVVLVVLWFFR